MIEQRVYPVADLPPLLECQVRDFVRIVWPGSNVDQPTAPLGPRDRNPVHLVIVDASVLISHAQILTFSIEHGAQTYRVNGLSGVFTYPNFRSGGYGKQVVAGATAFIAANGADFGMLFTSPDLETFYAGHGWVAIRNLTILAGDKDNPRQRDEFTMVYPATSHGQQAITAFENASVYVGSRLW